ncbi:REP-associated tyrosine transposase [Povalibacter sp.]|uniref:REP-associated tyrosine transposase n=1 Tax=Povalibacter sp. TaxID=1962978 RepID=UPI002F3F7119
MPYTSLLRGRTSLNGHYYVVTTATAHRHPLFASLVAGRVILNTLRAQDAAGHTQTLACVVMPDHVHWLVRLVGSQSLSAVVRHVKGRSAHDLNARAQGAGPVWQKGFHDHAVRSDQSLEAIARYVIENPIRAGIVSCIGDYSLWHCAWELPWALSG